ncbi:hypothetical protein BTT_32500 [Bacillus thuringiensis serovar morrisoni str. 4AA1]|uniref:Uncharacterized protein n=1 Tax=Bacillus cereus HuB4-4 TaxID=1053211 RepID=A0A9W5QTR0_BACCE|nr:hypothetical protein IC1_01925 [Bacillus cereus VD022]EOP87686.1 hypothetical protein IGM_03489 [Bacillus cereus HuB4-4]KIP26253.1 putative membrane protein [Bacillus thuringiensis serovar morrisoni]UOC02052.1 hypothetical protein BTT_32500 [Bacillus thuringiensis serovar morrisoni str. 4AA1]
MDGNNILIGYGFYFYIAKKMIYIKLLLLVNRR